MRGVRVAVAVVATLGVACSEPVLAPKQATTPAALFDAVWSEFDLQYSMFALKSVNWESIRAAYRPRALAAPTDAALAKVIGEMLLNLHDRHVVFEPGGVAPAMGYLTARDSAPPAYDASLVERQYLTNATTTPGGHVRYGRLASGVGYLRIPSFAGGGWASEVDVAIEALRDAPSIVVDVRCNPGGSNGLAIDIAGRFADRSRTFGYVRLRNGPAHDNFTDFIPEIVSPAGPAQFRGQVYLLTDRKNYSSAEDFVLAMHALPNVTSLGDTTGGASGKPIVRELPNGWTYQLSSWIEYTVDRKTLEDVGIAPDVFTGTSIRVKPIGPMTADPVLDRAMATAANR